MNRKSLSILSLLLLFSGCKNNEQALKTEEDVFGYVVGIDIGNRLKKQPFNLSLWAVKQGLEDAYFSKPLLLNHDSIVSFVLKYQKKGAEYENTMQRRRESYLRFQDSNRTNDGVVSLPNGLQYKILNGRPTSVHPMENSKVKCRLKGYLLNGKILEDSFVNGPPRTVEVGKAIEGVKISLQLMSPGMKIKAWIPSQIAFGRDGVGDQIPAYALIVYEIELIEIE